MARDYKKLRTFHYAEELAMEIYKSTRNFPKEEIFGLTSQMRRAAVSVAANIVEGSQRNTEAEFLNFLNIALGSAGELGFYLDFTRKLSYLAEADYNRLLEMHRTCITSLQALIAHFRPKR